MRRFIRTSSIALVGLAMLAGPLAPVAWAGPRVTDSTPSAGAGPALDSWIVTLVPGSSASQAASLASGAGGHVGHVYTYALQGFQLLGSVAAAEALRNNPHVLSVTPDHDVFLTESLPTGIERVGAYDNDNASNSAYHQGFRGNGSRIAIMDTGIDLDHPDLVNAIDQGLGKNCVTPTSTPDDGYGHGTHVAGTAAAPLNGVGVVGVAPEARLVAVKVFDDAGNSSESLVLCGFEHVLALNLDSDPANDVDVLNMSFGEQRSWGDCSSDPLHTAVCRAFGVGIVMVAGAGNSAVNAGNFVPAAYPEVISVSALADFDTERGGAAGCGFVPDLGWFECDDTLAFFSNYGSSVDVMASGVMVYSTWKDGQWSTSSGTSMATPHVSGVAALMTALTPTPSPATVRSLLQQSGECPNGSEAGADASCGGQGTWPDDPDGIPEPFVNALRAVRAVGGEPPPPGVPGAPTLTSATGGNGSVALAWSAPASDGGSPVTNYEVWRGTTSGGEVLVHTTVDTATTYTDLTVTNGTTYYYQVAAVNGIGSGPRSNERSATPLAAPPVIRTGDMGSNFASASSATGSIAFSLPAGSNRLVAMVSMYFTTVTVTSVTWKPDPTDPSQDQAFTFVGRQTAPANGAVEIWELANPAPGVAGSAVAHVLSAATKRIMDVHALSGVGSVGTPVGAGANSTAISVDVPSESGAIVFDVLYGNDSTTSYTAGPGQNKFWDANTGGGLNNLRGAGSEETGASSVTMSWTAGAVTNMALLAVSFNPAGEPPPPGVPGAPTLTSATGGNGSVALAWSAPASDGGSPVTNYEVWRGTTSGGEVLVHTTVDTATTYTDLTVTNGTTYYYQVAAVNGIGSGPRSNERSATPLAPPPPPPPVVPGAPTLTSAIGGDGSVALAWTAPASDGGSPVTDYEVWRGTTSGGEVLLPTPVDNGTSYTDATVTNGTTYYYQVAAVNAVGPGPRSNELSATPQAPPPPPPPPDPLGAPTLTSATGGDGSVTLAWTAPASDGGSPVTNYEVWRGTSSGGEELVWTTGDNGTTFTDATVTNGTTYYYQVAAVNAVGPGPRSNELSATPQAPPPSVTRTGGTASTFASASSTTGSVAFTLPAGSNRLVAMVSVGSTSARVASVTWRPNDADPTQDLPFTFVGRQTAPAGGAVEVWTLANPTPTVSGSSVDHVMNASAKRVMGIHALAGAGNVGTLAVASTNGTSISVDLASQTGALVLDVLYGNNSTTSYTAGAGQTEHWDTNTTKSLANLRGCGSEEAGAPMVTMSWTSAKSTNMAMMAVTFTP